MAAKKRRRHRAPQPGRAAARQPAVDDAGRTLEHWARKEEARQQRTAIRRRMAMRRYARWTAAGLVLAGLVTFLTVRSLHNAAENRRREQAQQSLLSRASAAAKAAGCTKVQAVPAYAGDDQQHVPTLPALTTYPSQPPTSGPHFFTPLRAGFYASPPDLGKAIHSLEHGAAELWFSPSTPSSRVAELRSAFGVLDHVIVAPYDYSQPRGQLPAGRQMVLVAWHKIQYCDQASAAAASAFVHAYAWTAADTSAYKGEAPEAGAAI